MLLAHGHCPQVKIPPFDPYTIFIHDLNVMIITSSSACPHSVKCLFSVIISEFLECAQVTVLSYTVERLRQKLPGIHGFSTGGLHDFADTFSSHGREHHIPRVILGRLIVQCVHFSWQLYTAFMESGQRHIICSYCVRASSCKVQWVQFFYKGGVAIMNLFYHSACWRLHAVKIATAKCTDACTDNFKRHSIVWIQPPMFPRVFCVLIKTISNKRHSLMQACTRTFWF